MPWLIIRQRHVSSPAKLVRKFIGDVPPAGLVDKAATVFSRTKGDIRSVLSAILLDTAWLDNPIPKYKRPINFITSALRMLNAQTDGGLPLHDFLGKMGQRHFAWPTPDGYPDETAIWQANLMPRWQFALDLAQNNISATRIETSDLLHLSNAVSVETLIDQFSHLLLGASLPAELSARPGCRFARARRRYSGRTRPGRHRRSGSITGLPMAII